jgi:hypothetical protein
VLDAIRSALTRPLDRPESDPARTALLGTLLVATAGLVLPAVLLAGYAARVLRAPDEPPTFDDLRPLAADGCRLGLVGAAYGALPAGLVLAGGAGVASGLGGLAFALRSPAARPLSLAAAAPTLGVGAGVALLGGLLAVPAGYLAAVAAVRVARTRRLGAGFDATTLALARRRTTARAWLASAGLLLAGRLVGAALGALPVVGGLAAAAVGFHATVAAADLWTRLTPAPAPTPETDATATERPDADAEAEAEADAGAGAGAAPATAGPTADD